MGKSGDLSVRVEQMQKKAQGRANRKPGSVGGLSQSQHLPSWSETVRGVPNSILRSALFGAIKRGRRAFLQGEEVASYKGVTILQTGPRLDQADLDVWEQCLHLARTEGLGTRIQFTVGSFLRSIGRSNGMSQYDWVRNAFRRLASSVIEVQDGNLSYFGPMIHHGTWDRNIGLYVIEINPAIAALYGKGCWTQIELKQRLALKKQPLAQWLHGFYSTHANPFPYKVETLHQLCGSQTKLIKHFRADLKDALGRLEEATGWLCEIDDGDLVKIKKRK